MTIQNVKVSWADALKEGFHEIANIDVPFKAEGCIHLEAEVQIIWFIKKKIKIALCFH